MSGKRANVLRDYHLLIKREIDGFEWQVRYDRHANPVQRSPGRFATHAEAAQAGEEALVMVKREAATELG